jgi:hypothetical protein
MKKQKTQEELCCTNRSESFFEGESGHRLRSNVVADHNRTTRMESANAPEIGSTPSVIDTRQRECTRADDFLESECFGIRFVDPFHDDWKHW